MAEYWKSTPKYWCKYCEVFVKDTKFEKQQHEATGRHQGNIRRSLKGLHREQEIEARKQAQAKAEVARLNGLVPGANGAGPSVAAGVGDKATFAKKEPQKRATVEDRKRQWEQLASMGIALPEEARQDMGMAGDWKVVTKKVVGELNEQGQFEDKQLNKGVHKRKVDETEEDRIAAEGLITKKKGWGHTYKLFPGSKGNDDDDLDALLGTKKASEVKEESKAKIEEHVKDEAESKTLQEIPTVEEAEADAAAAPVKQEEDTPAAPAIVFKKRKKIKV
ncbi:U1 zinc finger domain-containing protein [Didymella exigua CBS 183.55]|uniref:U1 zinc finger domain-containing protein n=1 Tax=Didymella exigua CBS 183.55 TaxID=1150837 RepID=A0A6A5RU16_9PLEO|nr:U1 zinc finger domain-containing protein [Didymella exigua CBS 183.55]KAF1930963.1 U1 zinc finger domain-containing protein [Didymella exigua CBS 183.55]